MWKSCLMSVMGLGLIACGSGEEFVDEPMQLARLEQKAVQPVGPLQVSRGQFCSTKLADGKVLFIGGATNNSWNVYTATAEVYDPATRTTSLRAPMRFGRRSHSCLSLRDGSVLVMGGATDTGGDTAVEKYNPSTNTWTLLAPMPGSSSGMAMAQLDDGRVLVAGGNGFGASAFLFDPAANVWTRTGSLTVGRSSGQAIKLADGRVLVLGGFGNNNNRRSVEVYSPSAGTWSTLAPLLVDSGQPTAALLPDGRVIVGEADSGGQAQAQVYDVSINTWTLLPPFNSAHGWGARMVLVNGEPIVAGGNDAYQQPQYAERFDFAQQRWISLGALTIPQGDFTLEALADGSVLAAGGINWSNSNTSALMDLVTFSTTPPSSTEPLTYTANNTNSAQQNTVSRTFTLNAGDTVEVGTCNLTGASATGDTYLRLFGAGTQVAYNDDSCGGTASFIQYTATTSGTYELRAGCYSSGSCGGTVTFRITSPTSALTYSASNTNSAQQNTTNRSFKLNAGDTVEVGTCNLTGTSATGDTYLRLFGAGTQVAYNDDSCGGTASFIQYTAPSAGTYELYAGCYSSTSCGGTVAFRITPAKK